MQTGVVVVIVVALGVFIFFQVRGFVRDLKERKRKKCESAEHLKESERSEEQTFE